MMLKLFNNIFQRNKGSVTSIENPEGRDSNDQMLDSFGNEFMELCIRENIDSEVCQNDGCEILAEGLKSEDWPTIDRLESYSDEDIKSITKFANSFLEIDTVIEAHIRYIVDTTLWHCQKLPQRPNQYDYF